jgi:hypothetical protein
LFHNFNKNNIYVVNGLYGGDVDALTAMYTEQIQQVNDLLAVPTDASVCTQANPLFDGATTDCTLFETGYEYTGLYYQGMFKSPVYYAQVSDILYLCINLVFQFYVTVLSCSTFQRLGCSST